MSEGEGPEREGGTEGTVRIGRAEDQGSLEMKTSVTICVVAMLIAAGSDAMAETATMYVGTANAYSQFDISDAGDELYYYPQPDTNKNWYYADGTMVTYTRNDVTAPRDGMKTFAATSVAYGQRLDSVSFSFDFIVSGNTDPHGEGLVYQGFPNMNIAITDGNGTYALWSLTSGGTPYTTTTPDGNGWSTLTVDLTDDADNSEYGKINESTNAKLDALSSQISQATLSRHYDEILLQEIAKKVGVTGVSMDSGNGQ